MIRWAARLDHCAKPGSIGEAGLFLALGLGFGAALLTVYSAAALVFGLPPVSFDARRCLTLRTGVSLTLAPLVENYLMKVLLEFMSAHGVKTTLRFIVIFVAATTSHWPVNGIYALASGLVFDVFALVYATNAKLGRGYWRSVYAHSGYNILAALASY